MLRSLDNWWDILPVWFSNRHFCLPPINKTVSLPGSILRPEVTWRWSPCCRMMWLLLLLLLLTMAVIHSVDDDYLQTDRYHVNLSHHNRSTRAAYVQNVNCTLNTSCNFTTLQIHADYLNFLGSPRRYRWTFGYGGNTRKCFGLCPVTTVKYLIVSYLVSCFNTTCIYRH